MSFKVFLPFGVIGIIFGIHEKLVDVSDVLIKNLGVSFGQYFPGMMILIILFCLIIFRFYLKEKNLFLLLVLAGGVVNLIDRIRFGFVRDYWQIGHSSLYNNVNDWLIFLGILLFLINLIWIKKSK